MPRISFFFGIVITMYWREDQHQVAHFHAAYGGQGASVAFDGAVLGGSLPPRVLRLVQEWALLHTVRSCSRTGIGRVNISRLSGSSRSPRIRPWMKFFPSCTSPRFKF